MGEFTSEDIEEMSSKFEEKFSEDQITIFMKKRTDLRTNRIVLAQVFISAHDSFQENINLLEEGLKLRLRGYLSFSNIDELRNLLEDYGDGSNFSSYISGQKIKNIVEIHKIKIKEIISLFYSCFFEEE